MSQVLRRLRGPGRGGQAGSALAVAMCALGAWVCVPSLALAAEPVLTEFCKSGAPGDGANQCNLPRGLVADPVTGDIYVADQENNRVQKFSAWGEFERAWGWDVVVGGPEDELEVCVPADGDVCKAGVQGGGRGQLVVPQGLTIDADGNVYVAEGDVANRRVQKFDPNGNFLLMFGGKVNKTKVEDGAGEALQNRCPVDPDDVCQAGVEGTGNGQFGPRGGAGSFIAVTPDRETIYVGDKGRIQEFDTDGNYVGELLDSEGLLAANTVKSLAVDPSGGDLYVAFFDKGIVNGKATPPNVHRLDPVTGVKECELVVGVPTAVAVDADGHVYVFDHGVSASTPKEPGNHISRILEFDDACGLIEVFDQNKDFLINDKFTGESTGLATSSACGIQGADVLVANAGFNDSFIRLYGPPPQDTDPPCSPPPTVAPVIEDQFATSVGVDGATVRAKINPIFWPDARYYVEYGTEECSKGGCSATQPLPPGLLLTDKVVNAVLASRSVSLTGLAPATTYHYRFVAESSGGGPAFGPDPDGDGPEEASFEKGLEGTFTTYSPTLKAKVDCPNRSFRSGLSASLPDCRAYELVSPLDKNNGDIATDETFNNVTPGNFQLTSPDGNRATYSSFISFGSPGGSPLFSQYLSSRDPVSGWLTNSISPPRSSVPFYPSAAPANSSQFKAFSEDLCSGWFIQDTNLPLVPNAPSGVANIYRRDFDLCSDPGYELTTPVPPLGYSQLTEPGESHYFVTLQGISADSRHTLLRANAVMDEDACDDAEGTEAGKGINQVYMHTEGQDELKLVSVLPSGAASCTHSSAGTGQGLPGNFREDNVHNALSEDASRVFWSAGLTSGGEGVGSVRGPLYVRLNPNEEKSDQEFGSATGTGDSIAPVEAVGTIAIGNSNVFNVTSGDFVEGQEISDSEGGIPAGTTVVAIEEFPKDTGFFKLALSAPATKTKAGDKLVGASAIINVKAETGEFAVGQSISGPFILLGGTNIIPAGTTIVAVEETSADLFRLTLSAGTTKTESDIAINAWSDCVEAEKACTVPISAAPTTQFWGASPNGETAIYTADGGLFEYDVASEATTMIAGTGVDGVLGMSQDASHVYFVSTALLTGDEPNGEGAKAIDGGFNLYLYEQGAPIVFVGTLSGVDTRNGGGSNDPFSPIATLPYRRASRVSADGLHATFLSAASLTGYDNTDVESGEPDAEVFLFDASPGGGMGDLRCISCNPSGARPRGRNVLPAVVDFWAAALLPGWESQLYPSRVLSADGDRLFFESLEGLVLRDTNGMRDVYEWRRAATKAECIENGFELYVQSAGGCIGLISSGKSTLDTEYLDASASGRDVFFMTGGSLLPQDFGLIDVYDAREGGGFRPPDPPKPPCEGEACQPAPPPPVPPTPASTVFEGKGNVVAKAPRKRCGKSKRLVRRGGKARCVKKAKNQRKQRPPGRKGKVSR